MHRLAMEKGENGCCKPAALPTVFRAMSVSGGERAAEPGEPLERRGVLGKNFGMRTDLVDPGIDERYRQIGSRDKHRDRAIGVAFDVDDARFGDDVVRDVDRAALHIEARALGYTEPLDDPPPGWIAVDRPRELHSLGENAKDAFIAAHHLELSRRSRT